VIYRFDAFTLDTDRAELHGPDGPVALERKAFDLLVFLLLHPDRVVTKDEVIAAVWQGRFISDAALATLVKSLRRALRDDGERQRVVRTIRGRGFRLGVEVLTAAPARAEPRGPGRFEGSAPPVSARPKIAVLRFHLIGESPRIGAITEAIPADLIATLSRLRWLPVVARESSFRLGAAGTDLDTVRTLLGAAYAVTGTVELLGERLSVTVEVTDTRSAAVLWADRIAGRLDDVHELRARIEAEVAGALEIRVPLHESERARTTPSEQLDAWGAYHLGLRHAFRFNARDNAIAAGWFETATRLDPDFASAHAALSFTSHQTASMGYDADHARAVRDAEAHAQRSLELDPLDPFANFVAGRVHSLHGRPDDGLVWLDRSTRINPSFAKGHYAHGHADLMAGRTAEARSRLEEALTLSPMDPLLCAMLSAKGLTYLAEGDHAEAVRWTQMDARAPGAHFTMLAVAMAACRIAGDSAGEAAWLRVLRERWPDASVGRLFTVLPFGDGPIRALLADALHSAGLPP
jgi:TolB-like protein/Tfp pilus assembly protein PilF